MLQWSDAITKASLRKSILSCLREAFAKATKLRVPLVDFCDMVSALSFGWEM